MRQTKFRGKRLDNDQWVEGDLLTPKPDDDHYYIRFADDEGDTVCYEVNPHTVGEYTGLEDKNGMEIYEGDVVHARLMTGDVYVRGLAVTFERGCFIIDGYELHIYDELKVIGNLHDNPKLLEAA